VMELYGSRELGEVLIEAARIGLYAMVEKHASPACQYGIHAYVRKLFSEETRRSVRDIIREIRDGSFAAELVADQAQGHARLKEMVAEKRRSAVTDTEARLRGLFRFREQEEADSGL
jgi:ketol-acid reductoisomerase